jgi:hypothetical protein
MGLPHFFQYKNYQAFFSPSGSANIMPFSIQLQNEGARVLIQSINTRAPFWSLH